jgi:hypothetical protein
MVEEVVGRGEVRTIRRHAEARRPNDCVYCYCRNMCVALRQTIVQAIYESGLNERNEMVLRFAEVEGGMKDGIDLSEHAAHFDGHCGR